jgi:drug/metabolite transporter (DMT)-like permease
LPISSCRISSSSSRRTTAWLLLVVANVLWASSYVAGAAPTLFIQPLPGTQLGVLLLQEALTPYTIFGGLLIIVSVYLLSRQ